jgi:N-carbamoyl-L-amino-acid hydrolase
MKRRELVRAALASGLMTPIAMGRRAPSGRVPSAEPSDWRVNGDRVNGWLRELSRFGANPEGGVSRTGFSDADVEGRAWLREVMRAAGLEVRVDPAGNLIGARPGSEPGAKPLLFGSHIDSVPHGGNYDGDVGSLGAVEVALTLRERGYRNRHPLWVTVWCDEERGLTGSRGFLGNVTKEELARPYVDGMTLGECIRKIGGDPEAMAGYRHEAGSVAGYVELHIEQGGTLDRTGIRIGVVEGIVTIHSSNVTVKGVANHAGTTPMPERKNALLAASELALAVDRIVKGHPGRQVGTVGRFEVKPGASNVIPGEVSMSIELRDLSVDTLNQLWHAIAAEGDRIMARRGTTWDKTWRPANPPAVADPTVRSVITEAAKGIGLTTHSMPSGAGHDAQNLARIGPMGMIFVPSVGGISHAPQEYTKPEDVTNGVNALLQTILALDAA